MSNATEELRLFIFHDDIEEIMVSARDGNDAFDVVDEALGDGVADDLILSFLNEYPPEMVVSGSKTASQIAAKGRRIVEHRHSGSENKKRMIKPSDFDTKRMYVCPDRA